MFVEICEKRPKFATIGAWVAHFRRCSGKMRAPTADKPCALPQVAHQDHGNVPRCIPSESAGVPGFLRGSARPGHEGNPALVPEQIPPDRIPQPPPGAMDAADSDSLQRPLPTAPNLAEIGAPRANLAEAPISTRRGATNRGRREEAEAAVHGPGRRPGDARGGEGAVEAGPTWVATQALLDGDRDEHLLCCNARPPELLPPPMQNGSKPPTSDPQTLPTPTPSARARWRWPLWRRRLCGTRRGVSRDRAGNAATPGRTGPC